MSSFKGEDPYWSLRVLGMCLVYIKRIGRGFLNLAISLLVLAVALAVTWGIMWTIGLAHSGVYWPAVLSISVVVLYIAYLIGE